MARTLGTEEADQVTQPGRKVLIGWTGPADGSTPYIKNYASAQSLPRELSLGPDRSLRQAFVSELQVLRDVQHYLACAVRSAQKLWLEKPFIFAAYNGGARTHKRIRGAGQSRSRSWRWAARPPS